LFRIIAVIAVVAMLLGAGGATAAQVITGKQIKNNSVTGKDIRNESLTRSDFKGSVRGPRGPAGPQGSQGVAGAPGAQGPAGPRGAAGATSVIVRSGPVSLGDSTAHCNPGERAVGGGGFTGDTGGYLYNSTPLEDVGQTPTAWTASAASAEDTTLDDPVNVQAWVICAAP
jgi:hypothetical protein